MDKFFDLMDDGLSWPEAILGLGMLAFAFAVLTLLVAAFLFLFTE
jgi:hypothetical protein